MMNTKHYKIQLCAAFAIFVLRIALAKADEADVCDSFAAGVVQTLDNAQVNAGIDIANEQASQLIALIQSARGGNLLMQKLNSSSILADLVDPVFLQNYAMSSLPFIGPVAAVFVLALLVCPCFTCARCCCTKKCCKPKKLTDEYSTSEVYLPIIFYLLFALIASVLAVIAISNVNTIYSGAVGTVCEVELILEDTSDLIDSLASPLQTLATTTTGLVDTVNQTLARTENIGIEMAVLVSLLRSISSDVASITLPGNASGHELQTLADTLDSTATLLSGSTDPFLSEINNMESSVMGALSGAKDMVTGISNSSLTIFQSIGAVVEEIKTGVVEMVKAGIATGLDFATPAAYSFYSIVFLALAAGVLVVVLYCIPGKCTKTVGSALLNCSWFLSYLFMLLLLLLGLVYLSLSIVLSDVCDVAYDLPNNFDKYLDLFMPNDRRVLQGLPAIDPAVLISGCFATPSIPLITALNLSGSIDVNGLLSGLSLDFNASIAFNFSLIEEFDSSISNMQPGDFGIDQAYVDLVILAMNNLTGSVGTTTVYTQTMCTITGSCDRSCLEQTTCAPRSDGNNHQIDNTTLDMARTAVIDMIDGYHELGSIISGLQQNASDIVDQANQVLYAANNSLNDLELIRATVNGLAGGFTGFASGGNCSFIAERYYNVHEYLCGDAFQGLYMVSLFNVAIAVLAIPVIITSVCINIRMFGVGSSKTDAAVHAWNDK